jgi:hypothetical protein
MSDHLKISSFPYRIKCYKFKYCHVVCVTTDGVRIGDSIYWPLIHTNRDYTLHITDTHTHTHTQTNVLSLLQSPLAVSWQLILTQALQQSHWITHSRYHIQTSLHRWTLAPNSFLHYLQYRTELSRTTQKTPFSYRWVRIRCRANVFTELLPGNGRGTDQNTVLLLLRACMLQALPINCRCLQSHRFSN